MRNASQHTTLGRRAEKRRTVNLALDVRRLGVDTAVAVEELGLLAKLLDGLSRRSVSALIATRTVKRGGRTCSAR